MCYQYAYLTGREKLGQQLSKADAARLSSLRPLLEATEGLRGHRRFPVALPVLVRVANALRSGMLLNISGSGMFIVVQETIAPGETVHVKLGDSVQYSFFGEVRWTATTCGALGIGLCLNSVPVEVRHGDAGGGAQRSR